MKFKNNKREIKNIHIFVNNLNPFKNNTIIIILINK